MHFLIIQSMLNIFSYINSSLYTLIELISKIIMFIKILSIIIKPSVISKTHEVEKHDQEIRLFWLLKKIDLTFCIEKGMDHRL